VLPVVDLHVAAPEGVRRAAEPPTSLEQHHLGARVGEGNGRGQPGEPSAHDDDTARGHRWTAARARADTSAFSHAGSERRRRSASSGRAVIRTRSRW
jgi:hypothetical protein